VLLLLLRSRLRRIEFGATAAAALRIVAAAAVLAATAFGAWYGLDRALGNTFAAQLAAVLVALTAGAIAYLVACRALRVREMDALLALRTRLKRA
jgi:hypothetical protein